MTALVSPIAPTTGPAARPTFGDLLRDWRRRRHLSQYALALGIGTSQRHLSFLESGRAGATREMIARLAEHLGMPPRARNHLLLAAGFAPAYAERPLTDPTLAAARRAVEQVLAGHEPYPAVAIDRYWTLVAANRALGPLLAGVHASLLTPPVNVLRLTLHPDGLAPRIVNLGAWRAHLLERVAQQADATGDPTLTILCEELRAYPARGAPASAHPRPVPDGGEVFIPLQLATERGLLTFLSTTTVFGTPVDLTLSELALECFFPADESTAAALRASAPTDR